MCKAAPLSADLLKFPLMEAKDREPLFQTLFESSPDAIFIEDLVGNVLDFSRLENQSPRLVREPVAVAELLDHVAVIWQTRCHDGEKELAVEVNLAAEPDHLCFSSGRRACAVADGDDALLEGRDLGPAAGEEDRRGAHKP